MPLKEKEKIIVARLLYLACLVVLEYNNKDKIRYVKRKEKESGRVTWFSLIELKSME
jgi:hypothetical protein